jgi:putative YhdH/YhfP family quinone oxidoreductase
MAESFRAFVVNKTEDAFEGGVKELTRENLPDGEVLIRVVYSSLNYKDGLASTPNGQVVRKYPFVPGIDLAGRVVESTDKKFRENDEVIVTSYGLGVSHYGGFSEYARVPAAWVVPLPRSLNLREAMTLGTAGFTAALAIHKLEINGLKPENGPVLITGATGGVGSHAISMLSNLGYTVAASTGKEAEQDYLRSLGASEILSREEVSAEGKPLEKERWAGSVDAVGGNTLAYLTRSTKYGGSIASIGNTGGPKFTATVFPFILRGINLLGIDSVACPMDLRLNLWNRLANDLKPKNLAGTVEREIGLEDLSEATGQILAGKVRGRLLIKP